MVSSDFDRIRERYLNSEETWDQANKHFFFGSLDLLCLLSLEGVIVRVNPTWEVLLGLPLSELRNSNFLDHFVSEDREALTAFLCGLRETFFSSSCSARVKSGNGYERWITWNATVCLDRKAFFLSGRDVTEARRAEREIQRLASFPRFNPNPVLEFSEEGALTYANAAANIMAAQFGCTRVEDILPAETKGMIQQTIESSQPRLRFETTIHERVISWSFFPIPEQRVVHCYCGDITEQKRAELDLRRSRDDLELAVAQRTEELGSANQVLQDQLTRLKLAEELAREAESKFRGIFENAIEGIFQSTPGGQYLSVNPALARMYGYESPAELISEVNDISSDIYLDPSIRSEFQRAIEQEGKISGLEYQVRRKDGRIIWISEHARAVRNGAGETVFYEGTIQDITKRKEAEQANAALEARLRQAQKMEALGTLAGGIAHDFNNILSAILGYTDLALDGMPAENPRRRNMEAVMRAADRAKDLVKQILTFSRQTESSRQSMEVVPIVKETLKLIRATLPASIEVNLKLDTIESRIIGDPSQIHQVLMNLCANAGYAMRNASGKLEVTVKHKAFSPAEADQFQLKPGNFLSVAVADTGHGMSPKVLERIFEPFFTTKPVGEGTGLGLAVVHGIVTSHGGIIQVRSTPEKGTTFTVYLPLAATGQVVSPVERAELPPGYQRVLFVDDEPAITDIFAQKLSKMGYEVTCASRGVEALQIFLANPSAFDVIVTDMTMPGMSGMQLARGIREVSKSVQIIICSGFFESLSHAEVESLNINQIITKPVNYHSLHQLIQSAVPGPG
ncbi:MAG: PAS domain S-box protein [Verrucomicrobiota bacterium]|nr:PAS domain S-box protein [Verrucomicrobiota bacterium]